MKHNVKITLILVSMFLITQFIGLWVVNAYLPNEKLIFNSTSGNWESVMEKNLLPYSMEPPEAEPATSFTSIIISFAIAIFLILILTRIKAALFLRLWFFLVVVLALGITMNSVLLNFSQYSPLIAIILALPLAYYKLFKRNLIVHNLTELMIYPGIAAIFVLILNPFFIVILLILISIYDMWAVWKSEIMQKMAKFQINELKLFAGFYVPYMDAKTRLKLKQSKGKMKRVRVNLAILGGGDVVFPIIAAGIFMRFYGLIPAITIIIGAALGLIYLFINSEKKKFYPAMPFITIGIFLGMIAGMLLRYLI